MDTELTEFIVKKIADFVLRHLEKAVVGNPRRKREALEQRIDRHLRAVNKWSQTYSAVGLGVPRTTDTESIELALHTTPRKYRGKSTAEAQIPEGDLLLGETSFIILGNPGSGKTTTLKRIARQLLTMPPTCEQDVMQYPLLVQLRDLSDGLSLMQRIADIFGLEITNVLIPNPTKASGTVKGSTKKPAETEGRHELRIDNRPVHEVIGDMLTATQAVLLLDGLDEVPYPTRTTVESEIRQISKHTSDSKILLTCRSGDYRTDFGQFCTLELLPLDDEQIQRIASLWLGAYTGPFFKCLAAVPYRDIVDRPLILTFLLYLFRATGELPPQPSQIYREVVYRLLKDWDENRSIKRVSRYAHFDADRKIDFLSELAYFLTYKIKGKVFAHANFAEAYLLLAPSFDLPLKEMEIVASEVETHTGLLFASGVGTFEFSHLSLQEYLCANYLVRSPHPHLLAEYLEEYPAPVAVACALSSDPSRYFAEVIKRHLVRRFRENRDTDLTDGCQMLLPLFNTQTLPSFLTRMRLENPAFRSNAEFGMTVLCLFAIYFRRNYIQIDQLLRELLELRGVSESLAMGIKEYEVTGYRLSNEEAAYNIDDWFASLYFEVNPPWHIATAEIARLSPRTRARQIAAIQRISSDHRERKETPVLPDFPLAVIPCKLLHSQGILHLLPLESGSDIEARIKEQHVSLV